MSVLILCLDYCAVFTGVFDWTAACDSCWNVVEGGSKGVYVAPNRLLKHQSKTFCVHCSDFLIAYADGVNKLRICVLK